MSIWLDEDGRIVSSRAERYKLWAEKKSSIALPPLHMLESVGETIAAPTTINDEVTSKTMQTQFNRKRLKNALNIYIYVYVKFTL